MFNEFKIDTIEKKAVRMLFLLRLPVVFLTSDKNDKTKVECCFGSLKRVSVYKNFFPKFRIHENIEGQKTYYADLSIFSINQFELYSFYLN